MPQFFHNHAIYSGARLAMSLLFCKFAAVPERGFANLQKDWDAALDSVLRSGVTAGCIRFKTFNISNSYIN